MGMNAGRGADPTRLSPPARIMRRMLRMRVFVYKRTHPGDPGPEGCFGIDDCMGSHRNWKYDAVIGVGGIGGEPESHGIDGKINWIGIGPDKKYVPNKSGPEVTFDHFRYYGSAGRDLCELAPNLANRIYSKNVRVLVKDFSDKEYIEVENILKLAENSDPSSCRVAKPDKAQRLGQCVAKPQTERVEPNEGPSRPNRCG